jgi:hypothetical protein
MQCLLAGLLVSLSPALQLNFQASLLQPAAALAAFHPTTGIEGAYQLLTSCLQDGCLPAAQQLLLLQLMHSMQQQGQLQGPQLEQCAAAAGATAMEPMHSSGGDNDVAADAAPALLWPEFVLHRMAGMAVTAEPNAATAGADPSTCVALHAWLLVMQRYGTASVLSSWLSVCRVLLALPLH